MDKTIEQQQQGLGKKMILGFQHLFAMFGATVLVPLLTGLNPAVAICCAGIGTLIFHLITKGKVPVLDVYKRQGMSSWQAIIVRSRRKRQRFQA